jgi:heat shock transcription factor
MEAAPLSSSVATTGNKEDMAPFLEKTYDIVNDPNTDAIVSWSSTNNSFVVWNLAEFTYFILPTYFKHKNFLSFIRQLSTYVCHLFLLYSLIHFNFF